MKKNKLRGWLLGMSICILFFSGCIGGTSQPSVYYVFHETMEKTSSIPKSLDKSIGVGPVKIPEFLNRPQIVRRQGNNVLEINEFQRWGDSFETQITDTLVENLSVLLGTPDVSAYPWESSFAPSQQVYLDIRRFDGPMDGPILLEAVWRIIDTRKGEVLITRRSSYSVPLDRNGIEDYVKALNIALEKLSMEIVSNLKNI